MCRCARTQVVAGRKRKQDDASESESDSSDDSSSEDDAEYIVEAIMGERGTGAKRELLIRWEG